ncbi:hypothetical protein [Pectobacterium punjabense]|uniref:hypothetical protein n=1 Tax=Pectobacterium punjabense TaxID=2108399 RepID=UPI002404A148|nr:hypothetical protein [Pectobacterium punjabense]MDG0798630.1 hypothetical protein [Pectobacterium punjabense]
MDDDRRKKWNNSLKTNIQGSAGRDSLYHAILAGNESGESPLTLHKIAENKKRNQNSSSSPPPSQQKPE